MDAIIGVNLLPGTLCIAAENYRVGEETVNGEISFLKGDILTIVSHSPESAFCHVTTVDGSSGEIPITLLADRPAIPLHPLPWFHNNISRSEAEELLQVEERGQFLLRTSQNTDGVCALAVSNGSEIKHYLIAMNKTTGRLSLDGERYFGSLSQLVQFYMAKEKQHSHLMQEQLGSLEEKRPESPPLSQPIEAKGMLAFDVDWRTMNQKWGIKSESIEIVRMIGKGEFGDVNAGVYKGLQVAMKSLSDNSEHHSVATRSFLQEAAVMTHLQHKNLVQLLGVVFSGSTLKGIVMELMVKGSVVKYLSSRGRSVVSQAELLQIARNVCEGMLYITSKGFVHRDLAARNVLLDGSGQAKISDFGLARRADIHVPNEGGKFPVKWTAPESMKESIFSERSDVWSFGILLWEIYSFGRTPYPSILSEKVLGFLEDGDVMDCPDGCPDGIYDIMVQCWEMEPSLRPMFHSLQSSLAKSFGESWTPCSSPLVARRSIIRVSEEVEGLVTSPVASDIYREAPEKNATIHVTNILLVGAEGSGKTSLSRCFQGKQFRVKEAPTLCLSLPQNYSELVGHRDWISTCAGLSYERELVRIIAAELLKNINPPSPSPSPISSALIFPLSVSQSAPPPIPALASHPAYFSHPVLPQDSNSPVPPVLPVRKKRATSLNAGNAVFPASHPPIPQRYSMNLEAYNEKPQLGIPTSGSHPEGLSAIQADSSLGHRHWGIHIPKKFSLSKLFGVHRKTSKGSKPESTPVAAPSPSSFLNRRNSSPTDVPLAVKASPLVCKRSLSVPDKFSSALPEQLEGKVKEKLKDCVAGTIPAEVYGRIVDMPSNGAITALEPMLLTDSAVIVAVLDVSKQFGNTGFQNGLTSGRPPSPLTVAANHLLTQLMVVSEKWLVDKKNGPSLSPQIVLVGTHTDKTTPAEARTNYDAARRMLQSTPCGRFITSPAFFVSCSSTIDRGTLEEFKRYIVDAVKKHRQEEVPLRWLRCIRRFQGLAKEGQYLLSEADCRAIVRELCGLKEESELGDVMHFLNRHLVILQFPASRSQQSVVVTDPTWFFTQIGNLFTIHLHHSAEATLPQELSGDLTTLCSKGTLSDKLLDHVWHFSKFEKRELLLMLSILELVFLLGKNSQPLLPWSLETGRSNSPQDKRLPSSSPIITAVIIPSLVQVPCPSSISHPAATDVEPLYFVFRWGVLPSSFFPRLIVRCMHNYSSAGYTLYRDAACFFISANLTLVLQACADSVKVTLQPSLSMDSSPPSPAPHLESSLPESAMAARMFLQASVADIVQQWLPSLSCDPCFLCHCLPGHTHYTAIGNVESFTNHAVIKCQLNNTSSLSPAAAPWFGEELKVQQAPFDDNSDQYVSTEDIALVAQSLEESFATLGSAMGFSDEEIIQFSQQGDSSAHSATEQMLQEWCNLNLQNASFLDLVSSLEDIGRIDVADNLIDSKMKTSGVAL